MNIEGNTETGFIIIIKYRDLYFYVLYFILQSLVILNIKVKYILSKDRAVKVLCIKI